MLWRNGSVTLPADDVASTSGWAMQPPCTRLPVRDGRRQHLPRLVGDDAPRSGRCHPAPRQQCVLVVTLAARTSPKPATSWCDPRRSAPTYLLAPSVAPSPTKNPVGSAARAGADRSLCASPMVRSFVPGCMCPQRLRRSRRSISSSSCWKRCPYRSRTTDTDVWPAITAICFGFAPSAIQRDTAVCRRS